MKNQTRKIGFAQIVISWSSVEIHKKRKTLRGKIILEFYTEIHEI